MKLAHVVPSLEERHGGPSRSVRELAAAQARLGLSVELYSTAPRPADGPAEAAVPIHLFRREWPRSVCRSRGLAAALRAARPDIVHHHSLWLRTLHYARAAARHCPLVVSPRGMMSDWAWRHHRWRKRFARLIVHPGALRRVAGWHATSPAEAAEIRGRGFSQPICVAPNGIAEPSADSLARAREYWLRACPEAARRPVAVYYSRFHRKKRLLELIDMWLERAAPDWLLLVVGIPEEYSVEMLEDYVVRASGQSRVQVHEGTGRPAPYAIASLFVLASHNENFGLAIAEAMAAGVSALVTDGTPWKAIQAAGVGWCVPWDGYADALAAATRLDPAALKAMGAQARAWVLANYSWDVPARSLHAFYAELSLRCARST